MLTLDEVRNVLAEVKFDSTTGETGFTNGISNALREFRDRIALRGEYTPEELARIQAQGEQNARFIIQSKKVG